MTPREVFDKVKAHLLAQGQRSATSTYNCRYRLGELKCAAGAVIADEYYTEDLESKTASQHEVKAALLNSGVPEEAIPMLQELQDVHDCEAVEYWPAALDRAEAKYFRPAS